MDALFRHSKNFYESLEQESKEEVINGVRVRIYRGKVTELFHRMKISQSYYSRITNLLSQLGCVTQLQRGSNAVPSVYALHFPPDEAEYEQRETRGLTQRVDYATLSQRIDDVHRQIGGIDVKEVIANHETRLNKLEKNNTGGKD